MCIYCLVHQKPRISQNYLNLLVDVTFLILIKNMAKVAHYGKEAAKDNSIDSEHDLLSCYRYIELNPVRAGMGLLMVMLLSLLVYGITERRLRTALKTQQETLPNHHIGEKINNPTLRWVFQ